MIFKLTASFTETDIQKQIDQFVDRVNRITENELNQIGLEFVAEARSKVPNEDYHADAKDIVLATKAGGGSLDFSSAGGFNDQTGNLRSSIGYIIMRDGNIVHEDFELSPRGTEKASGLEKGKAYGETLAKEFPSGWAIITVAGMEYASWVEARGFDVITGSTLGAEAKLTKALDNVIRAFK